jgi:hypothetical protein
VLVLTLENITASDLEVLRLELPEATTALRPEAATKLVKQPSLAYLLYPVLPGLAALGASDKGGFGPSDRALFQGFAILGACIGIPNALIAARSNRRLEAFFREQAWSPGTLGASQTRRGLVFLRSPDPYAPLPVRVVYRGAAGERRLALLGPGARPL